MNPNVLTQLFMREQMIGSFQMEQTLTGDVILPNGTAINSDEEQEPISDEIYYIVADKCTECVGFHEEPQCAAVCPVDCCVPDEDNVETEEELLGKQKFMHED